MASHFPADPYGFAQTVWEVINRTHSLGECPRIVSIDLDNVRTTARFETDSGFDLAPRALELLDSTAMVAKGSSLIKYAETSDTYFQNYGYIQMASSQSRFNDVISCQPIISDELEPATMVHRQRGWRFSGLFVYTMRQGDTVPDRGSLFVVRFKSSRS